MNEILQFANVTKAYRHRGRETVTALRDISMRLERGEMRCVYGPSGSGKSTLLLCAGGLLRPDQGVVTVAGRNPYELTSESRSQLRAQHVGFVFQQFHLLPYLNVLDNVLAPSLARVHNTDLRPRAEELIERFGLTSRRDHPPSELSVGERQRVALARALIQQPHLLLADEPTGNLDADNGALVMNTLRDFAKAGGAVMVVTHDSNLQGDDSFRLVDGTLAT